MGWTYSGDPSSSAQDEVRFLIGDTDQDEQLLTDEEIAYTIQVYPDDGTAYSNYRAAAECARSLSAKFARLVNKTVGSLSLQYGSRAQQFRELAQMLEDQSIKGTSQRKMGAPILGGGGKTYLMGNWTNSDDTIDDGGAYQGGRG